MLHSAIRKVFGKTIIRRRLPNDLGGRIIFTSPAVALGWLKPDVRRVDPFLCRITPSVVSKDDIVWDIGANVGLFTLIASSIAGPQGSVLALEPDPWLCELFRKSMRLSRQGNAAISLIQACISNSLGLKTLYFAGNSRAANFIEGQTGSS